jgi:DNA-binding CsgD family transcriptional regulator
VERRLRADSIRRGGRRHACFGWSSLTEPEVVIARLVAEGLTNREIARHRLISIHTVDAHIRHIYCKLGIASRTQLTRVVVSNCDEPALISS